MLDSRTHCTTVQWKIWKIWVLWAQGYCPVIKSTLCPHIHLGPSMSPPGELGELIQLCWCSCHVLCCEYKSSVSDPGVLCLQLAATKLWQARLPCRVLDSVCDRRILQRHSFLEEEGWGSHGLINGICKMAMKIDYKPNCTVPRNQVQAKLYVYWALNGPLLYRLLLRRNCGGDCRPLGLKDSRQGQGCYAVNSPPGRGISSPFWQSASGPPFTMTSTHTCPGWAEGHPPQPKNSYRDHKDNDG